MIVYNVLFKGVEIKMTPFCKVFLTSEEAEKWIDSVCNAQEWRKCSSYASDIISDWRVEDKDGNTYYFVTYKQELIIEAPAPAVKFIDLHLAIISAVQKDIGCGLTEATEIVDRNETYLIDMIEGCGETNVEFLADVITTNDN
jgi:hypothetical protein